MEQFSLAGRVAVVTGGARGLGREHARALAEAGAAVAFCDLLVPEGEATAGELAAAGHPALFQRADVTAAGEIDSFLQAVTTRFGRIDVLVNNAAMPSEGCSLDDLSDELWRKIIDTNLTSMFLVGKRVARVMRAAGRGSIINIASINAFVISNIAPRYNAAYCVAKAGVAHLTRAMAAQWAADGIRVNALAPGYILTDQTAASARIPEVYERNLRATPMGRYGRMDELAGSIVYLASDASSFMTGSVVTVDGGYTVW